MVLNARAAVVRRRQGTLVWEDVVLDDLRPDEIYVRLIATGICHTDIAFKDGLVGSRYPAVLGHEGAGVVERVGTRVRTVRVGDRVLLSFASCGECSACRSGHPAHCQHYDGWNFSWRRPDGSPTIWDAKGRPLNAHFLGQSSFSTHVLTHERNAVQVSATDDEVALFAPLGCGLQAGAGTVLHELRPKRGENIAVFGVGAVGLAAVMAASIAGAYPIIAVDLVQSRLDLARSLGAHIAINADHEPLRDALQRAVRKLHYAVDTTGSSRVINVCLEHLRARGAISLLGIASDEGRVISPGKRQRVVESVDGDSNPQEFLPYLVSLYKEGRFPLDRLVKFYPAAQINTAIRDSIEGRTVKPVVILTDV
jgi:aryl-alcohol dehydrogenase